MKAVVYAGTRNLYPDMETAAKSLLKHTKVDRIYFLIEDDEFPGAERLPDIIRTVNVGHQEFFPETCVNIHTGFTYMSLMRVCYSKLFPELDKILQLDVDTIVADDLSALWEMDRDGTWLAATYEERSHFRPYGPKYYNVGVAIFNLAQIRKDGADDMAIRMLNEEEVPYIDQDAWNKLGIAADKIVELPIRYNESIVTGKTETPAIVHFAGYRNWQTTGTMFRKEYLDAYRRKTWEEILHG